MTQTDNNWIYSENVKKHFFNPKNILKVPEEEYQADGIGFVGSPECGDMMKMWIKVKNDKIAECKWQTFGCASAISSTSVLSEIVTKNQGMSLKQALKITPQDIIKELGGLPDNKIHCSVLGDRALINAINDYFLKTGQKEKQVKEKKDLICSCFNIESKDIEQLIIKGQKTFSAIQKETKLGTACGKCISKAKKFIDAYNKKYLS